ncbi:TPA: stage V sporulation protein S [Candidatus Acetothermia bacterium]|nr:stage V sporulation protein S [Candidatus Acetothermia bacterium]
MLKVSSGSNPGATAGAIANGIRERGETQMQVIGPRAVNQAVKAIAIARGYLAASGVDLYFTPSFSSVLIEGQEKTAIHFTVRTRHPMIGSTVEPF